MTSFDCYWHWLFIYLSIISKISNSLLMQITVGGRWICLAWRCYDSTCHRYASLPTPTATPPPLEPRLQTSDGNSSLTPGKREKPSGDPCSTSPALDQRLDSHYFEASVTNVLRFPSMWNHCIPCLSVGNCIIICWQEFWNMCTTDDGNWRPTGGNWVLSKCRSTTSRITTIITWRNWSGVE